ncbi:MAG TPA: hypothetical protein VK648_08380 [Gemmatimonadaceae bacterium]|nr:MAG: hypothetical protein DMF56_24950 [Acidobacteriota bacterium]HTD83790.1 hypothetical protein [Gemmatimonadaceae bacterium]
MADGTPTSNPHETEAQELLVQLRALMLKIRGYGFTAINQRRRLIPAASLPLAYVLSVGVAVDASEEFARVCGLTGPEIRDKVNFTNAFSPVIAELKLAAAGLEQTIQTQKGELGQKCLKAYSMAKSFNRPGDNGAVLIPHIADMKRTLNRGRKKTVQAPPTAPVPAKPGDAPVKPGGGNA